MGPRRGAARQRVLPGVFEQVVGAEEEVAGSACGVKDS